MEWYDQTTMHIFGWCCLAEWTHWGNAPSVNVCQWRWIDGCAMTQMQCIRDAWKHDGSQPNQPTKNKNTMVVFQIMN
jgi:hypothetical protein